MTKKQTKISFTYIWTTRWLTVSLFTYVLRFKSKDAYKHQITTNYKIIMIKKRHFRWYKCVFVLNINAFIVNIKN